MASMSHCKELFTKYVFVVIHHWIEVKYEKKGDIE